MCGLMPGNLDRVFVMNTRKVFSIFLWLAGGYGILTGVLGIPAGLFVGSNLLIAGVVHLMLGAGLCIAAAFMQTSKG